MIRFASLIAGCVFTAAVMANILEDIGWPPMMSLVGTVMFNSGLAMIVCGVSKE